MLKGQNITIGKIILQSFVGDIMFVDINSHKETAFEIYLLSVCDNTLRLVPYSRPDCRQREWQAEVSVGPQRGQEEPSRDSCGTGT